MATRTEQWKTLFPTEPAYRWKQVERALFDGAISGWEEISTLPKQVRETAAREIPWITCKAVTVLESKNKDTFKALLQAADKKVFESVLMFNKKEQWTICVSSQIGCAMRCTFCATGTMGLKRSLTSDEIADQYRFWKYYLRDHNISTERISNIVFMGMGEPLANYDNVKRAIHTWLDNTDLGPTKVTVSSVGILPQLEKILTDSDWPPVKIAISLHSANQTRREEIVPTTVPDFLKKLADWSRRYAEILGNRTHFITYEYTLLNGVNDTPELAKELALYIRKTGANLINVIPYNPVSGKKFERSQQERIDVFKDILLSYGIDVTQRKTMGDDIAAACGQLVAANQ